METRKLGWTDLELTRVGLGTWSIGGSNQVYAWGPQDDNDSIATILRGLELGINWIDTAPVYGLGHSEELVSQALKGTGFKPIIATKCGLIWDEDGKTNGHLKLDSIRKEVESSLKRLRMEVIDLYQIHKPIPDEDIEEAWDAVNELVQAGKVRYAAVTSFTLEQLKRIQALHPVASLQHIYSMLLRDVEGETFRYCGEKNIGVLAYGALQKGLLAGKFTTERVWNLPDDDHRRKDLYFQKPQLNINLRLVEGLRSIGSKYGRTPAEVCVAWVLRRSEVTSLIVGARRPSQIDETVGGVDFTIDEEDLEQIEILLQERASALKGQIHAAK